MSPEYRFRAIIEDAGKGGAYVAVPFDVPQAFGKQRVQVKAVIGGEPYRGSLVRMGGECHILGIRKEIRERLGKAIGDEVEVILEEDTEPREVVLPDDLLQALKGEPEAEARFASLSYSHRREAVAWIEEARRPETRRARIAKTIQQLTPVSQPAS